MKKILAIILSFIIISCTIIILIYYKLVVIDSFQANLEKTIKIEDFQKQFAQLDKLQSGDYMILSSAEKMIIEKIISKPIKIDRDILVLRGAVIVNFKAHEFHEVKGNLIVSKADNDKIYVYSYNSRYAFMVDIPIESIVQ